MFMVIFLNHPQTVHSMGYIDPEAPYINRKSSGLSLFPILGNCDKAGAFRGNAFYGNLIL